MRSYLRSVAETWPRCRGLRDNLNCLSPCARGECSAYQYICREFVNKSYVIKNDWIILKQLLGIVCSIRISTAYYTYMKFTSRVLIIVSDECCVLNAAIKFNCFIIIFFCVYPLTLVKSPISSILTDIPIKKCISFAIRKKTPSHICIQTIYVCSPLKREFNLKTSRIEI